MGHHGGMDDAKDRGGGGASGASSTAPALNSFTGVELAPTGRSYCYWCDTAIAQHHPRVKTFIYHAPGPYSRNNGEKTGHNPGGQMHLFAHAQCAFQFAPDLVKGQSKHAKCTTCQKDCAPGRRAMSRMGLAGARCTPSNRAPLFICFPCLRRYTFLSFSLSLLSLPPSPSPSLLSVCPVLTSCVPPQFRPRARKPAARVPLPRADAARHRMGQASILV